MLTEEGRKILSESKKGEKNPRWNGGNSQYPNHAELKRMRIEVLKNSKGRCEICGKPAKIIHHIDGDKSNQSIDNLMALCRNCHIPLHCDDDPNVSNIGRPLKYSLICNMSVKEISKIFDVSTGTIYNWLGRPDKEKWLKEQLNNKNSIKSEYLPVLK